MSLPKRNQARLRLGVSHLREHKCKHSFQDTLNPLCSCELNIESTSSYFLLNTESKSFYTRVEYGRIRGYAVHTRIREYTETHSVSV